MKRGKPAGLESGHFPSYKEVSLAVYDITGRLVKTLVDESQKSGVYRIQWAGLDDAGERVPSGIYFYRLKVGGKTETKKVVLLR